MTTFCDLGVSEALAGVLADKNIKEPTPIQQQAIPKILAGTDILGVAPTGTGKTLAYLLPILMQLDKDRRETQAVVLAPTYELAMQIAGEARELSQKAGLGIRVQGLIGGANIARQIDKLKEKPQLVVGSAGRICELARKGKLKLAGVRFGLDGYVRFQRHREIRLGRQDVAILMRGKATLEVFGRADIDVAVTQLKKVHVPHGTTLSGGALNGKVSVCSV